MEDVLKVGVLQCLARSQPFLRHVGEEFKQEVVKEMTVLNVVEEFIESVMGWRVLRDMGELLEQF